MAKTKSKATSGPTPPFDNMKDMHEVHPEVQAAADKFFEQQQKANKEKTKRAEREATLIELMEEHGVEKVWVNNGAKVIEHSNPGKVKVVTPKKEKQEE